MHKCKCQLFKCEIGKIVAKGPFKKSTHCTKK